MLILFVGALPSTKKVQATSLAQLTFSVNPKISTAKPAASTTSRLPEQTAAGGRVILWALPPTSQY